MSEPTRLGDRYRLGRRLGAGGFGEVFEATDQRTGDRVAVKRLLRVDPYALMLFKQEFRLLCDCAHPNLVGYHELISDGDDWYVTMDYVDGVDLRAWVGGAPPVAQPALMTRTMHQAASGASDPTRMMIAESLATSIDSAVASVAAPPLGEPQVARLRAVLPQLESALAHLHARGLVHRDLKPSNILVGPDGRLVVLDFGLALKHIDDGSPRPRDVVGTLRYMSPEQAAGGEIGPASDWYSVGIMLYSLLLGVPPFAGDATEMLAAKRAGPPHDPREVHPGLPPDLCGLALALLHPDPERRPRGFGAASAPSAPTPLPFVGRAVELARLRDAWARIEGSSQGRLVLAHGPSGIGKSALVHEFLAEFRRRPGALTLHGRCYERESLPFKALDGVVDALAAHLSTLPAAASARLLPRYAGHLGDLFPVLARVPAMAAARAEPRANAEAHERRRRGFHALRELLVRIGEQRPLALFLDDLQWSDEDSLAALGELLAAPDPPPLLAIACCRSGSSEPTEPLAALHAALERAGVPSEVFAVGPLEEQDAVELARAALAERDARGETQTLRRAAAGHPLLLLELARAASVGEGRAPTVAELLDARIAALPPNARALLECAAVAGRPRPLALLQRAAALAEGTIDALSCLRIERLVRTRAGATGEEIAPFHDQVAEAALRQLAPERMRERHRRLAETLAAGADPFAEAEALHRHWLGAGDSAEALRWAEAAAERASASLAFERAAVLYRAALELVVPERRGELRLRLADALANAGHGPAAAKAYREASAELEGEPARHAMRRAAAQFLRSGHMDEGLAAARAALDAVGERWRATALRAGLAMQTRRMLRIRAEKLPRGEPRQLDARESERLEALWEIAQGLGGTDTVRGAELHGRHLALALRARDPYRAAKGLAWEAILAFAEGGKRQLARGWRLVELAAALATRVGNEHVSSWAQAAGAYGHWCEGRFGAAVAGCEAAAAGYRECLDVAWELGSVLAWCWAPTLAAQGDVVALRRLCSEVEREFTGLGDLYTLVTLRTNAKPLLHFVDDQPEAAVVEVEAAIASWSRQSWHLQHLFAHLTRAKSALYLGWPREALALLDEARPRAHAALQDRLQIKRAFIAHLRGCAAAMAAAEKGEPALLAEVARAERALRGERLPWCDAHAEALAGAALLARGERDAAAGRYRLATAAYDALGMTLYRAAARRRVAEAIHDPAGLATADAELIGRGVAAPAKLAAMLVPGPAAT